MSNMIAQLSGFTFSQHSLQDYTDCARRFELRYLMRVAWPAVESEPMAEYERGQFLGKRFHTLVQQYFLGVPVGQLENHLDDPELAKWWANFLEFAESWSVQSDLLEDAKANQGSKLGKAVEVRLSIPFAGYRLMAQMDWVTGGSDGRLVVVDWKTSRNRPRRAWLSDRLQTRVYRYLLVCAGQHLNNGRPLAPGQVEMLYWFAAHPDRPERLIYNQDQFDRDQAELTAMVKEIDRRATLAIDLPQDIRFPLTQRQERCAYCEYRSLCDRGQNAGTMDENVDVALNEEEADVNIDFDQIAEIRF